MFQRNNENRKKLMKKIFELLLNFVINIKLIYNATMNSNQLRNVYEKIFYIFIKIRRKNW